MDHLVYGVPDLLAGVASFAAASGVEPVAGGRHLGRGTANYLVGLEGVGLEGVGLGDRAFLEIIGPDPESISRPSSMPFGIAGLGDSRMLTWAVQVPDLDAAVASSRTAGWDPGEPSDMSRRRPDGELLQWRLTPDTVSRTAGLVPFLIDWGSTPHPASGALPSLRLVKLELADRDPVLLSSRLAAVGVTGVTVSAAAAPRFKIVLETPSGELVLS